MGAEIILETFKWLAEKGESYFDKKKQILKDDFESVIRVFFKNLEVVHNDYTLNLYLLKKHLSEKKLPPYDLLNWLREIGMKYRSDREKLWASIGSQKVFIEEQYSICLQKNNKKSVYLQSLIIFLESSLKYHVTTLTVEEHSYYRDYEYYLERVINNIELHGDRDIEFLQESFYDAEEVQQVMKQLRNIADFKLPERWKEVCSSFTRAERALAEL